MKKRNKKDIIGFWAEILFLCFFAVALVPYLGAVLSIGAAIFAGLLFYLIFGKREFLSRNYRWCDYLNAAFLSVSFGYLVFLLFNSMIFNDVLMKHVLLTAASSLCLYFPVLFVLGTLGTKKKTEDRYLYLWLTLSVTILTYIVVVDIPAELFLNNATEFSFALKNLLVAMLKPFPFAAVFLFLLSLLPNKTIGYVNAVLNALTLCIYLQYMFFNHYVGQFFGKKYEWSEHALFSVITSIVWVALIIGFIVLWSLKKEKIWKLSAATELFVFVLMFVSSVATLAKAPAEAFQYDSFYISGKEQFTVGRNENIVIFVVDAVDNKFITEIMEEDPAFFDEYKDFTMYSDTCSVYDLTTHSIPQMLLGYTYLTEYNPKGGLFLTRLKDNGFRILFFNVFAGLEKQYVDNYEDMSETGDMFWIDYPRIRSDLLKTSIFQSLPCLAKSVVGIEEIKYLYYVRYDKDEYEMVANDKLFREKLDLSYNENSDKCLYYHHLDGAHYPCKDFVGETKFCLDSFKEYMRQMKELGVYDDATLIVCSDHGRHDDDGEYPFPTAATPMFMIKKKNETHDSMVITSTPMYFMDFQSTVLAASGYFNPETDYEIFGKSIYDYDETSIRKRVWFDTDFHIRDIHKYTYVGDMKELERVVNAGEYEIVDSWAFEYEE